MRNILIAAGLLAAVGTSSLAFAEDHEDTGNVTTGVVQSYNAANGSIVLGSGQMFDLPKNDRMTQPMIGDKVTLDWSRVAGAKEVTNLSIW